MKLLRCKNGAILLLDGETGAYWVVTEICGRPVRLFAGATPFVFVAIIYLSLKNSFGLMPFLINR